MQKFTTIPSWPRYTGSIYNEHKTRIDVDHYDGKIFFPAIFLVSDTIATWRIVFFLTLISWSLLSADLWLLVCYKKKNEISETIFAFFSVEMFFQHILLARIFAWQIDLYSKEAIHFISISFDLKRIHRSVLISFSSNSHSFYRLTYLMSAHSFANISKKYLVGWCIMLQLEFPRALNHVDAGMWKYAEQCRELFYQRDCFATVYVHHLHQLIKCDAKRSNEKEFMATFSSTHPFLIIVNTNEKTNISILFGSVKH